MKTNYLALLILLMSSHSFGSIAPVIPVHFEESTKSELTKLDEDASKEKSLEKKYFLKMEFVDAITEREGMYDLAQQTLTEAMVLAKKMNKPAYPIYVEIKRAELLSDIGDRKQALTISQKALVGAQKINHPRLIVYAQNAVARNLKELGNNPEAYNIWQSMLNNTQKLHDQELILTAMMGLAASMPMEPIEEWKKQNQLVIDQAKKVGTYDNIAGALNNMADVEVFAGELNQAESLRKEAIEIQKAGDAKLGLIKKPSLAHLQVMLAKVLALEGKNSESAKLLEQGKALAMLTNEFEAKAHGSLVEASLLAEKGDISRATDLYNKVLRDSAGNDSGCEKFALKMLKYISDGGMHPPAGVIAPKSQLLALAQITIKAGTPTPTPAKTILYNTGDRSALLPVLKSL